LSFTTCCFITSRCSTAAPAGGKIMKIRSIYRYLLSMII
jgi:hypothetical protein